MTPILFKRNNFVSMQIFRKKKSLQNKNIAAIFPFETNVHYSSLNEKFPAPARIPSI